MSQWWQGYPVCDECGHILMGENDVDRCSLCGAYGRTYRRWDVPPAPPPPEPPRMELPTVSSPEDEP